MEAGHVEGRNLVDRVVQSHRLSLAFYFI
jgi:hypothetical protein